MQRINSPRTDDQAVEQLIQAKGKTAPRVTPSDIEANIVGEHYFRAIDGYEGAVEAETYFGRTTPQPHNADLQPLELLTFCVLVLKNGYTVHGHSACASIENFDAEIGRRIARENAVQQIWPLMGYALKEQLSKEQNNG